MSRLHNFFYNLDRAVASLGGAPPQETISSEVGRVMEGQAEGHFWLETQIAKGIAWSLDKAFANHTEDAIVHADKLDAADDTQEK